MSATNATSTVRDEDSALHIDRIIEGDDDVSIAIWGTEDLNPDVRLAYTYIPEEEFIRWLDAAGYTVTRREESQ